MVKLMFKCPVCKVNHTLEFPEDFAKGRPKYPFSYVYLHQYEGAADNVEMLGKTVLTTLYIDANGKIRGVEAILQEEDIDILSKEEAAKMITQLTNYIQELQDSYNMLLKKYLELRKECGKE